MKINCLIRGVTAIFELKAIEVSESEGEVEETVGAVVSVVSLSVVLLFVVS